MAGGTTNHILILLIKVLLAVFFGLLAIYVFVEARAFGYGIFSDHAYHSENARGVVAEAQIQIKQGESLMDISRELEEKHIVKNAYQFLLTLKSLDGSNEIQPGIYTLSSDMKPSDILNTLRNKKEE